MEKLELNLKSEFTEMPFQVDNIVVPKHREFYGRNDVRMEQLEGSKRDVMNVAYVFQRRLDLANTPFSDIVHGSDKSELQEAFEKEWSSHYDSQDAALTDWQEVQSAWWNNYFDTGDGFFYHPDGSVKIVRNANSIREMSGSSTLSSGALVLHEDRDASIEVYDGLDGAEFKRKELDGLVGKTLSIDDVKSHPVWNALVGDTSLLAEYAQTTFSKGKEQFGYDNMMGVWLGSSQDVAVGRLCYVNNLNYNSYADGSSNINDSNGRLVGVAPEVLGTQTSSVPSASKIADGVNTYLAKTPALEITKKGIRETVFDVYRT